MISFPRFLVFCVDKGCDSLYSAVVYWRSLAILVQAKKRMADRDGVPNADGSAGDVGGLLWNLFQFLICKL